MGLKCNAPHFFSLVFPSPTLSLCFLSFSRALFLPRSPPHGQVDSKTHPVAPQSKMPEVFAQLDSKITHMMKAVSAALVKDDRGGGGVGDSAAGGGGGGGSGGGGSGASASGGGGVGGSGDPSSSKDMASHGHSVVSLLRDRDPAGDSSPP